MENKVQGVSGVDTRFLVKQIREKGSMYGAIVNINEPKEEVLKKIQNLKLEEHVKEVSPKEKEILNPKGKKHIVFYDFGAKGNILNMLIKRNFKVTVVPHDTTSKQVMNLKPDFVFLSNGPGDPAELTGIVDEIKELIKNKVKIAGICLGHQLISLALGGRTTRLKFGHHSSNHPVKNIENGKVYITTQNHNYTVLEGSLPQGVNTFLKSLNDKSVEGLKSEEFGVISTQFHPEAAPGPSDAYKFFDMFIEFVEGGKNA
ncbi:carbamoyl phosphate synthase small subunit [Mycoplasma marinum]|uniref:carbamoyl phosphate synthase small subunit n=1 Tax=Mycoplasma marinum TaxID=1937190 RepID=UPI001FE340E9|nr:carbamoyl phosphate synthase small subunit [Mycoplasma marinum]